MEKGRFAPSPSGRMHLGNLFSALLTWLSARSLDGRIVLRMEDLDPNRCRFEYCRQLADDLCWLGLDWDEGYAAQGLNDPYLQSKRTSLYAAAFERLKSMGLVYPCYCSRAERMVASAPHGSDGRNVYDGKCKRFTQKEQQQREAKGQRPAWRLKVPAESISFTDGHMGFFTQQLAHTCGDFIIRRSDGVYAYQLAVVVDDGAMGVTQAVRGRDLLDSTPRQLYLYRLLGLTPPTFYHVPLLLAPDGRRLSKRNQDLDVGILRNQFTAKEIIGQLAFLAQLRPTPSPIAATDLISSFSWNKVPRTDLYIHEKLWES